MKILLIIILSFFYTNPYAQELLTGTYSLNNQSLIIHEQNTFEIYDDRWSTGSGVPYGVGKYSYNGDSLILNFDEIDTTELTLSMSNYLDIKSYKRKEGDEKNWDFVLQVYNVHTESPIPGIVINTESDTLLTNPYGLIFLNTDSTSVHITIFHPNWSVVTEELILNVSDTNKVEIWLTPPTYIPYRHKTLKFKIKTIEENKYRLYRGFHFYSEMKLQPSTN